MIEVIIRNPQTGEEEKLEINDAMAKPLKHWIKKFGHYLK